VLPVLRPGAGGKRRQRKKGNCPCQFHRGLLWF
jgi:hypothetical protein